MHTLRRSLLPLLGTVVLLWLFRAPMYRAIVSYHILAERAPVMALRTGGKDVVDLDAAIQAVLDTTANRLYFSTGRVSSDPHALVHGSPANCIGYAALFASLLKGSLVHARINERYEVQHVIGKLHIGPWDLHAVSSSAFWKDHDIVRIRDKRDGSSIHVDPTLYDAVGVGRVSAK